MKPSERIEQIRADILKQTREKTEYNKLNPIERSMVLYEIRNQAIICFLDEVADAQEDV